jgi:hypothetical protein
MQSGAKASTVVMTRTAAGCSNKEEKHQATLLV